MAGPYDAAIEDYLNRTGQTGNGSQVFQIGDQTYTATSPQHARELQRLQAEHIKQDTKFLGMPGRPKWDSMLGANNLVASQYQLADDASGVLSNDRGYGKFETEALRDGPSAYSQLMLEQQGLERQNQLDDINTQYNMGLQNSMDQIASQGGLYSGASERMGANSIGAMLKARQGARQDYNRNRLGILAQDESQRVGQLQNLAGMEMDRNRFVMNERRQDVQNSLLERDAKRKQELDVYNSRMANWAADKQADAQARAGGGGCFTPGTKILMRSGITKRIDQLKLGDKTFGGTVTKIIQGLTDDVQWYNYDGVTVTGDHAVCEDGKWIRVKDSKVGFIKHNVNTDVLYNISTTGHIIRVGDLIFSDFDEVDESGLSDKENLEIKNRLQCLQNIS